MLNLFERRQTSKNAKADAQRGIVAVLDIGTAKVTCLIARKSPAGSGVEVIGVGHGPSRGLRAGAVVDMDDAERAIRSAVEQAERMAGIGISKVLVSFAGGAITSQRVDAEMPVLDGEITDRHLKQILHSAIAEYTKPGRTPIHAIPLSWAVDDHKGITDPRGMYAETLGVRLHFITAPVGPLRNLKMCLERCRLVFGGVTLAAYAAGLATLVEDEMELGATVIDMGAGTTTIAVFSEGACVHTDYIPVGGAHVTNDLARGLSAPLSDAERLKILHASVFDSPDDDHETVTVPQIGNRAEPVQVPLSFMTSIVRPRAEEILEIVRERLRASGMAHLSGRRVVLTGGASQLNGLQDLAERILEKQVRIGTPIHLRGAIDPVRGPGFAVAAGLVRHATQRRREAIMGPPKLGAGSSKRGYKRKARSFEAEPVRKVAGAMKWLKDNF